MRPAILLLVILLIHPLISRANEPVLLGGGSTPPTVLNPLVSDSSQGAWTSPNPCLYPSAGAQIVSGGYINQPNVIYFGGPNSRYNYTYPYGCGGSAFAYRTPSVVYFGRGEAC